MPLFGSSSTTRNTTRQQGADGEGNTVAGGNVTNHFPDTVANFAEQTLNLAKDVVSGAVANDATSTAAIGEIAKREKTPEASFVPFALIAAAATALIVIFGDN